MAARALALAFAAALLLAMPLAAQDRRELAEVLDRAVGRVLVFDASERLVGTGSGYAVARGKRRGDLVFLTNNHVVENAATVLVAYGTDDGIATFDAAIINLSPSYDMAVLRLRPAENQDFTPTLLPLADYSIERGDEVFAAGFPGAADTLSGGPGNPAFFELVLTGGIVGKRFKASWAGRSMQIEMLQHNAAISGGNSGGPLVSACGTVVGLNTAGISREVQGTFWASSARSISEFLDASDIEPRLVASVCAGAIQTGAPLADQRILLMAGGALLLGGMGAFALFRGYGRTVPLGRLRPRRSQPLLMADAGGNNVPLHAADLGQGVTIGRGQGAGLRIDDDKLSREHAHLQLKDRKLMLQDVGSTNGTFVDGRRLPRDTPVQINTHSDVTLGGVRLTLSRPGRG